MIELLKKHKYKIIAAVCALAVLTGAFFVGGSLGNNAPAVVKSSTADVAVSAENTTVLVVPKSIPKTFSVIVNLILIFSDV